MVPDLNNPQLGKVGSPWTDDEVDLILASHLRLLQLQLNGQPLNIQEEIQELASILSTRSLGSINLKHSNIVWIFYSLGLPYLRGFGHGMENAQQSLREKIQNIVSLDRGLQSSIIGAQRMPVVAPRILDHSLLKVLTPDRRHFVNDPGAKKKRTFDAFRCNFLEQSERNQNLGDAGETLILNYQKSLLLSNNRPDLAERVDHVSKTQGDGLGYDILSYDPITELEIHIEVKTTKYSEYTPFIVSENEVDFSKMNAASFVLNRVFNFVSEPRFYSVPGAITDSFTLDPLNHIANR